VFVHFIEIRYLRATKWSSAKAAIERLEATLRWRREFGIYDLSAEQVEPEVSESYCSLGPIYIYIFSGTRLSYALFPPSLF
jgi:hypothetical protein